MTDFFSFGDFQGIEIQAWQLDRKPGMTSDPYWVEIDIEDLPRGQISIEETFRLWQDANFKEFGGPITMDAASTLTGPGRTGARGEKKGKLRRGGPLRVTSAVTNGAGGAPTNLVKLEPMFVAPSGITELRQDLASASLHNEGRLRFNLVDIRHFWRDHGAPVYGDYNIVSETGKFIEETTAAGANARSSRTPRTLADFCKYLCSCLPGSPLIHPSSDIFTEKFPPPVNQKYRGEPPGIHLERLLRENGLEIHLSHESNVLIARRAGGHKVGKFPQTHGGTPSEIKEPRRTEAKTVFMTDIPEGVFIAGGQRQQRITAACLPVFIDLDNTVKKLEDIASHWGEYSIEEARQQRLIKSERAYKNVPGKDLREKAQRRQIAQTQFFKLYAPAFLFDGAEYFNFAERRHPFMPMKDPVFEVGELNDLDVDVASVPKEPALRRTQILVRGSTIGRDYSDDLSGVEDVLQQFLTGKVNQRSRNVKAIRRAQRELRELTKAQKEEDEFIRVAGQEFTGQTGAAIKKFLDEKNTALFRISSFTAIMQKEADNRAFRAQRRTRLERDIEVNEKERAAISAQTQRVKVEFVALKRQIEKHGFAKLWINRPYGIIPGSVASVDKDSGVITINEIAGVMNFTAIFDLENADLIGDGSIEVVYNTDVVLGSPDEMTHFTFIRPDTPGGEPGLVKISQNSALRPTVVRDESLVIYEDEQRRGLNVQEVVIKAGNLAAGILKEPEQEDGYEYTYPGTWKVVTNRDINSVSWIGNGDKAFTRIMANHPDRFVEFQSLVTKKNREEVAYAAARSRLQN